MSMSVSGILSSTGTILTSVTGWLPTIFNTAIQSPIVVVFIGLAVVGVAVGFAKKLLHI